MKIFLIRHGETDWQQLEARGVRGLARSFAPLTPLGRVQIDAIANDYRLEEAEAILCSSYARALESAARLSRALNKPIYVEYDLHEWLPQKDGDGDDDESTLAQATKELTYYTGYFPYPERRARREPRSETKERRVPVSERQAPPPEARTWETLEEVRARVISVLQRYRHLPSIVLVSHAVVMTSLLNIRRPFEYAEIVPLELDLDAMVGEEGPGGVTQRMPGR